MITFRLSSYPVRIALAALTPLTLAALASVGGACGGGESAASSGSASASVSGSGGGSSSNGVGGESGTGGAGTGGQSSGSGGDGGSGAGGGPGGDDPCSFPNDTTVNVSDAGELEAALAAAAPGTRIVLAAGIYDGNFEGANPGSASKPVIVCGPREAILDGGSTSSGYVFHLTTDHWILSGFTVRNGQKGIMLDGAHFGLLRGLLVHTIGQEGIHFRTHSSDNTLELSEVRDTGLTSPGTGEGVYLGSAMSNWEKITGSATTPDKSDANKVLYNTLGPGITAEPIDIKEGTTGGEVRGNKFFGAGITGDNFADSWMDVKGNGYLIAENTGTDSPKDGFQTHVQLSGWGNDNIFEKNVANVNGPGFGFAITGNSMGNVVRCDNVANNAASGLANVSCTP